MPLGRVAGAAPQHAETVLQAAGDLGHRHHPDPGRGQLHRQRQPVQVAAHLLDHVGGQVGAGAGRPGPLPEQLDRRRQAQLRQQVHRLRGEAERGTAGGEHPQVLGHRHQGTDQVAGAAQDVLTVVQHQQHRAGTERGHDAAEQVGRDGPLADRGAPGLPGADDRGDRAGDVVVGGDARQGHELHHPLLGSPAHHLREAGLAQAAGADDRSDPGGAQQARHRGEVVVAADQRVGFVRHAVPDHRRAALQQLLLQGLQCWAGVGAKLLPQRAAVRLVPGQRLRRPRRRRLAAQQLHQHLLVPRTLAGQVGKRRGCLRTAAQPGQRQRAGTCQRPVRRCPLGPQRRHRVVQPGVGAVRGPVPQRQARHGLGECGQVVAGAGEPGGRRRAAEDRRGVDLLVGQRQAVAGGCAGDHVGAELGPGAGDDDLQRLGRVLGLLVRPEPVHQPGGAAAGAQVTGKQRQEATQPGAGDLTAAVGHPRQQGQLNGHPTRVASPTARRYGFGPWHTVLKRHHRLARSALLAVVQMAECRDDQLVGDPPGDVVRVGAARLSTRCEKPAPTSCPRVSRVDAGSS